MRTRSWAPRLHCRWLASSSNPRTGRPGTFPRGRAGTTDAATGASAVAGSPGPDPSGERRSLAPPDLKSSSKEPDAECWVLIHPQVADLDLRGPTCGDAGGRGYPGA